jgi:hypothetical protein
VIWGVRRCVRGGTGQGSKEEAGRSDCSLPFGNLETWIPGRGRLRQMGAEETKDWVEGQTGGEERKMILCEENED